MNVYISVLNASISHCRLQIVLYSDIFQWPHCLATVITICSRYPKQRSCSYAQKAIGSKNSHIQHIDAVFKPRMLCASVLLICRRLKALGCCFAYESLVMTAPQWLIQIWMEGCFVTPLPRPTTDFSHCTRNRRKGRVARAIISLAIQTGRLMIYSYRKTL